MLTHPYTTQLDARLMPRGCPAKHGVGLAGRGDQMMNALLVHVAERHRWAGRVLGPIQSAEPTTLLMATRSPCAMASDGRSAYPKITWAKTPAANERSPAPARMTTVRVRNIVPCRTAGLYFPFYCGVSLGSVIQFTLEGKIVGPAEFEGSQPLRGLPPRRSELYLCGRRRGRAHDETYMAPARQLGLPAENLIERALTISVCAEELKSRSLTSRSER